MQCRHRLGPEPLLRRRPHLRHSRRRHRLVVQQRILELRHLRRRCTDRYRSNTSRLRPSAGHTRRGLWSLHANCMAGMLLVWPARAYGPICRLTYTDAGKCRTQQLLVATPPLATISLMAMEELSPAHTPPAISIRQVSYFPSSNSPCNRRFGHLTDKLTDFVLRQLGHQ